ncbi:hypothetical protein [Photobacterium lucens]|uniref:hypothetical protein n=1 Tax=Photobacterium lucens TaxID=2562949 RepID=UPI001369CFB8|nr:hypothetical protein [Photobacterium lucens]MBP2700055.1 hypothetical protein [Vibrio parahaemolyticus]MZG56514.1 hypothetical protein [Photobacterium lucens]MZG80367.1 hypothetical protein [Photobacterium lucens]
MSINDISSQIESTIEELTEQAENLKENAEATIGYAQHINNEVVNRYDHYVPLDDQPYGEELVRTDDMIEEIESVIADLEQAREEEDLSKAIAIVKNAEDVINEHQDTFEDCFSEAFIQEAKKETSDDWDDVRDESDWDEDD